MRVGTAWEDITPDRPLHLLGQMHIVQRRPDIGLVQPVIARPFEDLVDPAPEHHVARQVQPGKWCHRRHAQLGHIGSGHVLDGDQRDFRCFG